jgi:hypothetical protein
MRTCEEVRFGKVMLGSVRLVEAHAHSIMGNSAINVPPHNFKQPCRLYYSGRKIKNYEFEIAPCGIMSMPNFINFRQAILYS